MEIAGKRKNTSSIKSIKAKKRTNNKKLGSKNSKDETSENNSETNCITPNKENPSSITQYDITEKLNNSNIYLRDAEREKIVSFLQNKKSLIKTLFISGQPGTGKTSLVTEIFRTELNKDKSFFLKFTINCMSLSSANDFYDHLFKELNRDDNLYYFKEILKSKNDLLTKVKKALKCESNSANLHRVFSLLYSCNITILLDEIDFLYRKSDEIIFFDIINIPYLNGTNIKIILISNNSDFDNEIFPKLKNRKIQIEKLVFKPFNHIELFNIMKKKLEDIKMLEHFSNDSLRFLSTKMNKEGDLRPIIEIVKAIVLNYKDDFISGKKKIELNDMFQVLKQKNINLSEIIASLTAEQKIVVVALYYAVKANGIEIEEKSIHEQYKRVKRKTNSIELSLEEFREVIKNFVDIGIIEYKSKSKNKNKGLNYLRAKYSDEELEIIFLDEMMYKYFGKDKSENDKEGENEGESSKEDDE